MKQTKCPNCNSEHIDKEWFDEPSMKSVLGVARVVRYRCMECHKVFNEESLPIEKMVLDI